jgi:hypothetical protein
MLLHACSKPVDGRLDSLRDVDWLATRSGAFD